MATFTYLVGLNDAAKQHVDAGTVRVQDTTIREFASGRRELVGPLTREIPLVVKEAVDVFADHNGILHHLHQYTLPDGCAYREALQAVPSKGLERPHYFLALLAEGGTWVLKSLWTVGDICSYLNRHPGEIFWSEPELSDIPYIAEDDKEPDPAEEAEELERPRDWLLRFFHIGR